MKPNLVISKSLIEQQLLCAILQEARSKMMSHALRRAVEEKKTPVERRLARDDADLHSLQMCRRVMRVGTFDEALQIVKEYVDLTIE